MINEFQSKNGKSFSQNLFLKILFYSKISNAEYSDKQKKKTKKSCCFCLFHKYFINLYDITMCHLSETSFKNFK